MHYFQSNLFVIFLIAVAITPSTSFHLSNTSPVRNEESKPSELDSDCDCSDREAYYHKTLRQIITEQGVEKMKDFLKDINPKRVCGSDGVFYKIECELLCTKANNPEKSELQIVKPSVCRRRTKSLVEKGELKKLKRRDHSRICICTRHYAPVCGSNGITYGNKCAFECAKHYLDPDIVIIGQHKCQEDDQTAL